MEMHYTAQWDCQRKISRVKAVCRSGKCSNSPAVSRFNLTLVFQAQLDLTFHVNEQLHFCSAYQIVISKHNKQTKQACCFCAIQTRKHCDSREPS